MQRKKEENKRMRDRRERKRDTDRQVDRHTDIVQCLDYIGRKLLGKGSSGPGLQKFKVGQVLPGRGTERWWENWRPGLL